MSTLAVDNITDEVGTGSPAFANGLAQSDIAGALNATGSAPIYACRAWVNFDGTGTPSIRESGNVSSITDRGTGAYTVNFTTSMPDASYSVGGSVGRLDDVSDSNIDIRELNTSSFEFNVRNQASTVLVDRDYTLVHVFR